ncbi:secreted and surface protein containing fasciclin-like repeats [Lachnospiraceae bacterium KM106-2]|nr:secreted and surface protein containing fasciclin-like repeats [Lachnospiraceae bacterium KM106-2]
MKRNKILYWISALALCTIILSTVYVKAQNMTTATPDSNEKDIASIINTDGRLSTLSSALDTAELVTTLRGDGPFTIFAPTNEAFEKLSTQTLKDLMMPENKTKLVDVLFYHVFPGRVSSDQATKLDGQQITMQNGKQVDIYLRDGELYINEAKVIIKDIPA